MIDQGLLLLDLHLNHMSQYCSTNVFIIQIRAVPELNVWEGRAAASFFFFTLVVGFLINKILWVVGDIKIRISCLVGKLKPTQLICVVLPQF